MIDLHQKSFRIRKIHSTISKLFFGDMLSLLLYEYFNIVVYF